MPKLKKQPQPKKRIDVDPMDETNVRIGANIRKNRRQANMTQDALAEAVGLSTFFIGSVERGQATASMRTLIDVADVLETTVTTLLGEAPPDVEALRRRAAAVLKEVPDADLTAVLTVLQRFARR